MSDTIYRVSKHKRTLAAIFAEPVRANVKWKDVESLLASRGAEDNRRRRLAGASFSERNRSGISPPAPASRKPTKGNSIGSAISD